MKAPSANRRVLVLLAGIIWSVVGLVLMSVATGWLLSSQRDIILPLLVGIAVGLVVHRFGFSKMVSVNLVRIYEQAPGKDKVCAFAFQNKRSYLTIVIMILLGYTLRHPPIVKIYLAPVYLAIGFGLFISSLQYYLRLF